MKRFRIGFFSLGVGVFLMGFLAYQVFLPVSLAPAKKIVTIQKGMHAKQIGETLERKGIVRSAFFFYAYLRFFSDASQLKAGSFMLSPSLSIPQITNRLIEGSGAYEMVRITIPEGFSAMEIGAVLEKKGLCKASDFEHYIHHTAKEELQDIFVFLKHLPVTTIEGYLFPETYFFSKGSSIKMITTTMLKQFQKVLFPLWLNAPDGENSPKQRFDLHRVLTVASIIQKEAKKKSEMPLISSVYYNRLKKRMPLGSCPTIFYALGQPNKQKLYYKDLEVVSPYNTYKQSGFPPSPIASPGKLAFMASLSPKQSPFLYFVSNGDGSHTFSKSYRNHLKVQK